MRSFFRLYLPIFIVEIYLIFTICLFLFGPIEFKVHNNIIFGLYLSLYIFALLIGYLFSLKLNLVNRDLFCFNGREKLSLSFFYIVLFLSFFANIIFYKNVMLHDSISLSAIWKSILHGLDNPELAYATRMQRFESYQGNKLLNILYFFIAFARPLLTAMIPFYWDRLTFFIKFVSLSLLSFQVFVGLSAGLNKPIFDFFFFFSVSLAVYFVLHYIRYGNFGFKNRKLFVCLSVFAFFLFLIFFGTFMSARGGDFSYFYSTSPLGDIFISDDLNVTIFGEAFTYVYVWMAYYLVQGYYGFSLSLGYNFDSLFGFGNSPFLLRQLEFLSGENLTPLTFQEKISNVWDAEAQWHSFYSHMANDVHFIGVVFVMFALGFYLGKVWLSAVDGNNIYAKLLIPLIALLFLFIPANNQVFGYLETFSYFLFVNLLWFFSSFKIRRSHHLRGI
ncbi:hypothetical protein [Endozoicomonas sp. SESOKO1]|uniref:hypothetical protein n=1 Tax=Endozoicomonas sp. SESOKO1 TaxID=2828742 RepID=UPI002148F351|nr:hypothetical protein [Endozoicomonas sp. SESOKO1]